MLPLSVGQTLGIVNMFSLPLCAIIPLVWKGKLDVALHWLCLSLSSFYDSEREGNRAQTGKKPLEFDLVCIHICRIHDVPCAFIFEHLPCDLCLDSLVGKAGKAM